MRSTAALCLWALLGAARGWAPAHPRIATGPAPRPRAPVNLAPRPRGAPRPAVDFRLAEDDAAPIALRCTKTGRTIDCFPGCFMRLEDEGEWYVVATPCDQPVAFAPSIDDDEDDDWVIIQDDDPRMDAVFAVAERAVGEELEDCAMVRSALFPTLRGDLDDQLEDDDDDDVDDDEFARLDEEGEEDDAVLSLLATFDVPELGHAYDMMRIEELYQLIARRGDADDCLVYDILDEAESEVIRPRVAAALDEFQDDGGDDDDDAS